MSSSVEDQRPRSVGFEPSFLHNQWVRLVRDVIDQYYLNHD